MTSLRFDEESTRTAPQRSKSEIVRFGLRRMVLLEDHVRVDGTNSSFVNLNSFVDNT